MIDYLRRRLSLEEKPLRLEAIVAQCELAAGVGVHVPGAARTGAPAGHSVTAGPDVWRYLLRKHENFEAVMTEQAAVRDDWR